ncbi:MAG TPA: GNAT family N-acetyltransferase [Clostridiales bacterium]|nr:GNAT family N-acetyltransferase [Clostridiales bacterium]
MEINLRPVPMEEREVLANLLEKYNYEFSQYDDRDVNPLGLYGYRYLDHYWTEASRFAYFIEADGKLAGFVMVNNHPVLEGRKTDFSLAEFFVLYKYRRQGVGKRAFLLLMEKHQGTWQLHCHPKNVPSVYFWDCVVGTLTGGQFEKISFCPGTEYPDGTLAHVYYFDSRKDTPRPSNPHLATPLAARMQKKIGRIF